MHFINLRCTLKALKSTHNGFVSDLLKWALKCMFYATRPWTRLHKTSVTTTGTRTYTRNLSQLHEIS